MEFLELLKKTTEIIIYFTSLVYSTYVHYCTEKESCCMLGKQDILMIRIFSLLKIVHVKTMIYQNGAEFFKLNSGQSQFLTSFIYIHF